MEAQQPQQAVDALVANPETRKQPALDLLLAQALLQAHQPADAAVEPREGGRWAGCIKAGLADHVFPRFGSGFKASQQSHNTHFCGFYCFGLWKSEKTAGFWRKPS